MKVDTAKRLLELYPEIGSLHLGHGLYYGTALPIAPEIRADHPLMIWGEKGETPEDIMAKRYVLVRASDIIQRDGTRGVHKKEASRGT